MRKLVIVTVLALLGFACGGDTADDVTVTEGPDATAAATDDAPTPTSSGEPADHGTETFTDTEFSVEMELDDFYFAPTTIKAPGGAKATLELHNEGEVAHTFTIDGLDVDQEVAAGQTETVTIDDLGTDTRVEYVCRFHAESQDMKGSFSLH